MDGPGLDIRGNDDYDIWVRMICDNRISGAGWAAHSRTWCAKECAMKVQKAFSIKATKDDTNPVAGTWEFDFTGIPEKDLLDLAAQTLVIKQANGWVRKHLEYARSLVASAPSRVVLVRWDRAGVKPRDPEAEAAEARAAYLATVRGMSKEERKAALLEMEALANME